MGSGLKDALEEITGGRQQRQSGRTFGLAKAIRNLIKRLGRFIRRTYS